MLCRTNYFTEGNKTVREPYVHWRGVPCFSFTFRGKMDDCTAEAACYAQLVPQVGLRSQRRERPDLHHLASGWARPTINLAMRKFFSQRIRGWDADRGGRGMLWSFEGCGIKVTGKKLRKWMHGGGRVHGRKSRKEPTSRGKAHKLFYERVDELGLLPLGLRRCNSVGYRTLMRINRKKLFTCLQSNLAIAWPSITLLDCGIWN